MNTPQDHLAELAKIREYRKKVEAETCEEQRLRWARLLQEISYVLDRCWVNDAKHRAGIVEIMELLEKDITVIDEFLKTQPANEEKP